jgi:predicted Zn-ribbon and HTH transcriptional regulator
MGNILTSEQKAAYIANPWRCPFCHSQYIETGHFDGEAMTQPVKCLTCDAKWVDQWELTGIKEVSE